MRLLLILAAVLLLAAPAPAELPALPPGNTVNVTLQFQTYPPDATVMMWQMTRKIVLGSSGERLNVPVAAEGNSPVRFVLHVDGFVDAEVNETAAHLRAAQGVLQMSPVTLAPAGPLSLPLNLLHRHRGGFAVLAGVCLAVGLVLAGSLRRRLRRAARLRELLAPDPDDENVRHQLGRWLILRLLGRGGCASVYEAIDADTLSDTDRVALKILHTGAVTDAFRARFRREVAICSKLNHPNLVRILDWGDSEVFFMTMELVEGQSLRGVMRQGPLPLPQTLHLLEPVCAALAYAHERGIVHHDLKPENVMVTRDGRVRVMDFGIATGSQFERLTESGDLLGTPGYIAPEQMNGVRDDPRSDLYALGVMAYEMLCGRQPFEDRDVMVRMSQHLMIPPPRLEGVAPALADVVDRLLAKTPEARYESATEAWEALREAAT
ncbi:MAG: serine/threonine-protein kinase [Candidatus Xenobia bacterium]